MNAKQLIDFFEANKLYFKFSPENLTESPSFFSYNGKNHGTDWFKTSYDTWVNDEDNSVDISFDIETTYEFESWHRPQTRDEPEEKNIEFYHKASTINNLSIGVEEDDFEELNLSPEEEEIVKKYIIDNIILN